MSVELLFDDYEGGPHGGSGVHGVVTNVAKLNEMASVMEPGSTDENKRRPHRCVVKWGATIPTFRCVIESLSTKYTMFSDAGVPLRATCTVKLKEADSVKMAASDGAGGGSGGSR
jgi:hypothetical protein